MSNLDENDIYVIIRITKRPFDESVKYMSILILFVVLEMRMNVISPLNLNV